MKITVNTEHCASSIQKACNITPSKAGSAYLKTMWLRADRKKGTLSFMTTDASTEFIGTCQAEVVEDGLVGVQSRAMTDLIRSLPPGVISMETEEDSSTLVIRQGKRLYKLTSSSSSWFQEFTQYPDGDPVVWNGESFAEIIERILFCISDEEGSCFGCLCVKPNGQGGIDFCGLDGNKFAICTIVNDEILRRLPEDGIKIQKKYIADVKKLLPEEDIEILIGEKRFFIRDKDGRETISVPLSTMSFVDYRVFMDKANREGGTGVAVKKDDLVKALSRVQIFNTKEEISVNIALSWDSITVSSSDKSTGSATETIDAVCKGDVPEVAFVTKSLIDILQHLPGDDVNVRISEQTGPCSFQSASDAGYSIVAMPMQVVSKTYYNEEEL